MLDAMAAAEDKMISRMDIVFVRVELRVQPGRWAFRHLLTVTSGEVSDWNEGGWGKCR